MLKNIRGMIWIVSSMIMLFLFCETRKPTDIEFDKSLSETEERMTIAVPGGYFTRGNSWDTLFTDNQNDELYIVTQYNFEEKKWEKILKYDDSIRIDSFEIAKYETTNRFFLEFVEDSGYQKAQYWSEQGLVFLDSLETKLPRYWSWKKTPPYAADPFSGTADRPVIGISWYEAEAFCNWYGEITGENVRLPTEAEWEKAARWSEPAPSNGTGNRYPWGDSFNSDYFNGYGHDDGFVNAAPVHAFTEGVSDYGTYNQIGNVWEWCLDWYGSEYYQEVYNTNKDNPEGPAKPNVLFYKVIRGGDFGPCHKKTYRNSNRHGTPVFYRGFHPDITVNLNIGFRFVIVDQY